MTTELAALECLKKSHFFSFAIDKIRFRLSCNEDIHNAPVICIPGSLGAGDTGDIAGLKCRNLTSDVSRQCRGCAGVLISR